MDSFFKFGLTGFNISNSKVSFVINNKNAYSQGDRRGKGDENNKVFVLKVYWKCVKMYWKCDKSVLKMW